MTILDKESGKKTTVNFEDGAEGRFSIETEDGTKATFGGKAGEMTAEGPEGVTEWKSLMHQEQGTKVNGMVHGKTAHKVEDVFAVFEANLKTAGFERISKTETAEAWIGSFRNEEKTRTIALTINWKNAAKVVGISYSSW